MYEDILRYYIYIGGTLLATFGSRTSITPRTPLSHRSTSPVPLANTTPAYAVHQKGVWSMVCIPLIYRYLGGFLGFFVSFLVTFRVILPPLGDLWNDFWNTSGKVQLYLWKTCAKLEKAPICTHLHLCWCQRYTSPVSISKNDLRAFTGHFKPSAYSLGANIQNFLQSGVRQSQSATQAEKISFKTFLCQRFFHLSLYLWKYLRILFSAEDVSSTLRAFPLYICSLQVLWQKDFLSCIFGEEF